MKPKGIILIRPGESEDNLDNSRYQTTPDFALKLTATGIEQARLAGRGIAALIGDERIHVYISPFSQNTGDIPIHQGSDQRECNKSD